MWFLHSLHGLDTVVCEEPCPKASKKEIPFIANPFWQSPLSNDYTTVSCLMTGKTSRSRR